jgi:acetyl-CoA C-acetyltransferase
MRDDSKTKSVPSDMEIVVAAGVRTPFGRFDGALKDVPAVDLAAHVMEACVERAGVEPKDIDELYLGCCVQAETGTMAPVVARQALLKAGFPAETVSMTLDRACCSSLTAVQLAARAIRCGEAKLVLAGGTENMSRTPLLLDSRVRWGSRIGNLELRDELHGMAYKDFNPVSVDAGEVALEHGVDRREQDEWAMRSQNRYAEALAAGKLRDEIVPIEIPRRKGQPVRLERDEPPRPDTTAEKLTRLPTVYGSPTVTPGNAPGLNAGAAMLLVTSRREAENRGLPILGEVLSVASVATEPRRIAEVPAPALRKALRLASKDLDEIDLFEINEAFAAMPLVASKILGEDDEARVEWIRDRLNVNGGAVAIGHPVGASGARILMTLLYELNRRGGGLGACSICGGLAQGDGAIVRVPDKG